jgi:hypothetical protein
VTRLVISIVRHEISLRHYDIPRETAFLISSALATDEIRFECKICGLDASEEMPTVPASALGWNQPPIR